MSLENPKLLLDEDGAPRDRIVGFETEYGFNCITDNPDYNETVTNKVAGKAYFGHQKEFEPSGERIYLDVGDHPELSTAEETSFLGAAHRLLAGHLKMARRYKQVTDEMPTMVRPGGQIVKIKQTNLVANTCDTAGNSWGSHENLLARRKLKPSDYIDALAIHHLSRIVWSGAGHIQQTPHNPSNFEFCLSEKAGAIWDIANDCTVAHRPLVNLRDTPYADAERFRRIHIVAGESIFSPFANALRLASGSIVLRACEVGVSFIDLMPENPIQAIRQISRDPELKTRVRLADGGQFSGIELQREIAERALHATSQEDNLTEQELAWGNKWIKLLDDLERDPESCARRVDWIIKRNLVERELEAKRDRKESRFAVASAKATDYHSLLPGEGAGMKLVRKGFFEDSPSGEDLELGLPLPATRARLRGEAIQRLRDAGVDFTADWMHLKLHDRVNAVILKDPYCTENSRVDKLLENIDSTTALQAS